MSTHSARYWSYPPEPPIASELSFWAAIASSESVAWISGQPDHHYGSLGLDGLVPCVGPTPPSGITFPIETYVKAVSVDGATTVYSTATRQQIPQLDPYNGDRKCCGVCTVYFSTVDVLYWPLVGANTACLDSDNSAGKPASLATIPPTNNSVSTTVGPDGFTLYV